MMYKKKQTNYDKTCDILLCRYHFLSRTNWLKDNQNLSVEDCIERLETELYNEEPSSTDTMRTLFVVTKDMEFRGKHHHGGGVM